MRWYVVEQAESHIIGEGFQEFTTDKHYAEYLLKKLTKQHELGLIDFTPIMREATEEETALLDFDFEGEEVCLSPENISSDEEVIADEFDFGEEPDLSEFDNLDDLIF